MIIKLLLSLIFLNAYAAELSQLKLEYSPPNYCIRDTCTTCSGYSFSPSITTKSLSQNQKALLTISLKNQLRKNASLSLRNQAQNYLSIYPNLLDINSNEDYSCAALSVPPLDKPKIISQNAQESLERNLLINSIKAKKYFEIQKRYDQHFLKQQNILTEIQNIKDKRSILAREAGFLLGPVSPDRYATASQLRDERFKIEQAGIKINELKKQYERELRLSGTQNLSKEQPLLFSIVSSGSRKDLAPSPLLNRILKELDRDTTLSGELLSESFNDQLLWASLTAKKGSIRPWVQDQIKLSLKEIKEANQLVCKKDDLPLIQNYQLVDFAINQLQKSGINDTDLKQVHCDLLKASPTSIKQTLIGIAGVGLLGTGMITSATGVGAMLIPSALMLLGGGTLATMGAIETYQSFQAKEVTEGLYQSKQALPEEVAKKLNEFYTNATFTALDIGLLPLDVFAFIKGQAKVISTVATRKARQLNRLPGIIESKKTYSIINPEVIDESITIVASKRTVQIPVGDSRELRTFTPHELKYKVKDGKTTTLTLNIDQSIGAEERREVIQGFKQSLSYIPPHRADKVKSYNIVNMENNNGLTKADVFQSAPNQINFYRFKKDGKDFFSTADPSTVAHELGHVLQARYKDWTTLPKGYEDAIKATEDIGPATLYGFQNKYEDFAENVSLYLLSGGGKSFDLKKLQALGYDTGRLNDLSYMKPINELYSARFKVIEEWFAKEPYRRKEITEIFANYIRENPKKYFGGLGAVTAGTFGAAAIYLKTSPSK